MTTRITRLIVALVAASTLLAPQAEASSASLKSFARVLYANPTASPQGLSAVRLRNAYHATGSGSAKIAIVTAYGHPTIKADLDNYSRVMGLPTLPNCTSRTQASCFEKIDQRGGVQFPRTDAGWALETALDVETVHALCPGCRIELVQADSATTTSLMAAVDQAVATGAQVVSMSWGGPEFASQTTQDHHFQKANVNFVASSGDAGFGVSWPAASNQVIAVGGTHLQMGPSGRATETTWAGAGSGCSAYESKPAWQHDPGCARRTVTDIAADADPATGAAIVTSISPNGAGWFVVGGTSLAAPIIAGLLGLTGATSHTTVMQHLYGSLGTTRLYDVVSGSNGRCSPAYFCTSAGGYDGPTGVGAPNSLSAF